MTLTTPELRQLADDHIAAWDDGGHPTEMSQPREGSLHVEFDDDGAPEHEYAVYEVTLVPVLLQCPVCELALDGASDELAGLPNVEERVGDSIYADAEDYYVTRLWDDD